MIMTKQRQLIMQYFSLYPENHPTAEEIYDYVKQKDNAIGIATVYRNLKKIVESGLIKELKLEKQGVRYDLAIQEHYHFICDKCGKIENFVLQELRSIDQAVEQQVRGTITDKDLLFHGVCESCLNQHEM